MRIQLRLIEKGLGGMSAMFRGECLRRSRTSPNAVRGNESGCKIGGMAASRGPSRVQK